MVEVVELRGSLVHGVLEDLVGFKKLFFLVEGAHDGETRECFCGVAYYSRCCRPEVHLDDGRALEIKVENEGKQEKDANHDPCEDNYIADEDVKGVDEDPGIDGNLWFDHSRFCKSVNSASQ